MKERTIFYSWQSDNPKTRNFILSNLKKVVSEMQSSPDLEEAIRLDKDTQGEVGSPDIAVTLQQKIAQCDIFIADVSLVGKANGRKVVNQNVMFELGFAIGKLTDKNVLLLANMELGNMKEMPFDIAHRRMLPFVINKQGAAQEFRDNLKGAILEHIKHLETKPYTFKTEEKEVEVDDDEILVLSLFAKMKVDPRVQTVNTMAGPQIRTLEDTTEYRKEIFEKITRREFLANLDSLVEKGVLDVFYGKKEPITSNYKPTKLGYKLIKQIRGSNQLEGI